MWKNCYVILAARENKKNREYVGKFPTNVETCRKLSSLNTVPQIPRMLVPRLSGSGCIFFDIYRGKDGKYY